MKLSMTSPLPAFPLSASALSQRPFTDLARIALVTVAAAARRAARSFETWRRRAAGRRQLARMSAWERRDIGITRADALWEAGKPFWRP
jgi:uncharacterized protein YjiS (DUF1127 family)